MMTHHCPCNPKSPFFLTLPPLFYQPSSSLSRFFSLKNLAGVYSLQPSPASPCFLAVSPSVSGSFLYSLKLSAATLLSSLSVAP